MTMKLSKRNNRLCKHLRTTIRQKWNHLKQTYLCSWAISTTTNDVAPPIQCQNHHHISPQLSFPECHGIRYGDVPGLIDIGANRSGESITAPWSARSLPYSLRIMNPDPERSCSSRGSMIESSMGKVSETGRLGFAGDVVQQRSRVEVWRGNGLDSPLLWSEDDFGCGEAQEEMVRAVIIQASLVFLLIVASLVPRGSSRDYSSVL